MGNVQQVTSLCGGSRKTLKEEDVPNVKPNNQLHNYSSKPHPLVYDSKNLDANDPLIQQLIQSKDNADVETLIQLIDNDTKISNSPQIEHPWAHKPESIGSLALIYLCQLFERSDPDDDNVSQKQIIQEIQRIEDLTKILIRTDLHKRIISNLMKDQLDRQELTIVFCFSFTNENTQAQKYFIKTDIIPILSQFLSDEQLFQISSQFQKQKHKMNKEQLFLQ